MKKKGISLVALVITIIVLIILTGAVISTFIEGGIIDKAKEAVKRSDYTTLREAYDIKYLNEKIDYDIGEKTGKINEIKILEETVKEIGLEKDFEIEVESESVEYTGENSDIKTWVLINFVLKDLEAAGVLCTVIDDEVYITNMKEVEGYTLKDLDGAETTISSTGYTVMKGDTKVGKIVFFGELDNDNNISSSDAGKVYDYMSGYYNPTEKAYLYAMDVNHDGIINKEDSIRIIEMFAAESEKQIEMQNARPVALKTDITYIRFEEYMKILDISKEDRFELTYDNTIDGNVYKITLNDKYTYAELYNKMQTNLPDATFNVYDSSLNEVTSSSTEKVMSGGYIIIVTKEKSDGNTIYCGGTYYIYIK